VRLEALVTAAILLGFARLEKGTQSSKATFEGARWGFLSTARAASELHTIATQQPFSALRGATAQCFRATPGGSATD